MCDFILYNSKSQGNIEYLSLCNQLVATILSYVGFKVTTHDTCVYRETCISKYVLVWRQVDNFDMEGTLFLCPSTWSMISFKNWASLNNMESWRGSILEKYILLDCVPVKNVEPSSNH